VDPEVLRPILRTLAQHFVTDRASPEVMAVGLNSIREICMRTPLAMTRDLLHDLVQYRSK
jgi:protein SDA1